MVSEAKRGPPEPCPLLPERPFPELWEGSRRVGRRTVEELTTGRRARPPSKHEDPCNRHNTWEVENWGWTQTGWSPDEELETDKSSEKSKDSESILMGETSLWIGSLLPSCLPPERERPKNRFPSEYTTPKNSIVRRQREGEWVPPWKLI